MTLDPSLIIVAVIAAMPGLWAVLVQRRRDKADVAGKYQELAAKQIADNEKLETENSDLRRQIAELRAKQALYDAGKALDDAYTAQLVDYIAELITVMRSAGLKPLREMPARKHV